MDYSIFPSCYTHGKGKEHQVGVPNADDIIYNCRGLCVSVLVDLR